MITFDHWMSEYYAKKKHNSRYIKSKWYFRCDFGSHEPPDWLFNIRVFDVCMLVYASGLTLKYHGNTLTEYLLYIIKRFRRLILPTWFFLIGYFLMCYCMSFYDAQWKYSISDYIKSFTFTGGIDYIWIIRVYFLIAIISPVIVKVGESSIFKKHCFICLTGLLLINEALVYVGNQIKHDTVQKLYYGFFVYTLEYSIVQITAYVSRKIRTGKLFCTTSVMFLMVWMVNGLSSPQNAKYPPQALYLLYGLSISLAVCCFVDILNLQIKGSIKSVVEWLSQNSLTIYFYHIIPVSIFEKGNYDEMHYLMKYILTVTSACILTQITILIKKISSRGIENGKKEHSSL